MKTTGSKKMGAKTSIAQIGKFLLAGLITNMSIYVAYLLLTYAGTGHKTSMSILFITGMMLSYCINKQWTFSYQDDGNSRLWRFLSAYGMAYILNLFSMWVAVDGMHIPHYLVQAVNIVVISALLFVAQKYWIFAARSADSNRPGKADLLGR